MTKNYFYVFPQRLSKKGSYSRINLVAWFMFCAIRFPQEPYLARSPKQIEAAQGETKQIKAMQSKEMKQSKEM